MTYLDHAATTPMVPAAIQALTAQLALVGNPSSLHSDGRRARRPAVCKDEGLPTMASCVLMASIAAGTMGVVAAWSR